MAELNEQNMKWMTAALKKVGVDMALFDLKAYWDSTLQYGENKSLLIAKAKELGLVKFEKELEAKTKGQVNDDIRRMTQEQLDREKEYLKEKFDRDIEEIKNLPTTDNMDRIFHVLNRLVNVLPKSKNIHALIVEGRPATGKTYNITKILAENSVDFVGINGYATPVELYNFIYHNLGKTIVIDDNDGGLFKNNVSKSIMLNALWGNALGTRKISYMSSTSKLEAPKEFELPESQKFIYITNNMPDIANIKSRSFYYVFEPSFNEMMIIMYEMAGLKNIPLEIIDFIKDNCNETHEIDLRTPLKIWELYNSHTKEWQDLTVKSGIIKVNYALMVVKRQIETYSSITEACKKFSEETGKSRATFYRLKQQLIKA